MHNCHSALAVYLEHEETGGHVPLLSFPIDKTALHTIHWHLMNTYCPNTTVSAYNHLNAHENCAGDEVLGLHEILFKKVDGDSEGQMRDFT